MLDHGSIKVLARELGVRATDLIALASGKGMGSAALAGFEAWAVAGMRARLATATTAIRMGTDVDCMSDLQRGHGPRPLSSRGDRYGAFRAGVPTNATGGPPRCGFAQGGTMRPGGFPSCV